MNSSIAASMIAVRRSAARSARFDAGFEDGGLGETILDALAGTARLRAGFAGDVVLERGLDIIKI